MWRLVLHFECLGDRPAVWMVIPRPVAARAVQSLARIAAAAACLHVVVVEDEGDALLGPDVDRSCYVETG